MRLKNNLKIREHGGVISSLPRRGRSISASPSFLRPTDAATAAGSLAPDLAAACSTDLKSSMALVDAFQSLAIDAQQSLASIAFSEQAALQSMAIKAQAVGHSSCFSLTSRSYCESNARFSALLTPTMLVALILLGLGGLIFPPLWLVFLVVLLAMLICGKPTVVVVGQNGYANAQWEVPKPEPRVNQCQARTILAGIALLLVGVGVFHYLGLIQ